MLLIHCSDHSRILRRLGIAALAIFIFSFAARPAAFGFDWPQNNAAGNASEWLVIEPLSATVQIGDTVKFDALRITQSNDTVRGFPVAWSSSNLGIATIESTGRATVVAPGLAGIAARHGDLIASARLIGVPRNAYGPVVGAARPGPVVAVQTKQGPAQGSRFMNSANEHLPNEPAGFRLITDRQFRTSHPAYGYGSLPRYATGMDASLAEGWENIEGKYRNFSVVPDPTAPTGDGMVGQMKYPKGMPAGVGPATVRFTLPPGIREAYFSFWVKLSPNWFGNDAAVNKQFFIGLNGGNNQLVLDAHGYGSQKLIVKPVTQGLADARDGGKAWPYQNPTEIRRGVWQRWELLVRVSSAPNVADGLVRFWQDGELTTAWDNVNTTRHKAPNHTPSVHMLNWNPTYGGGGTAVPADQYQWVDRVYISGR